MSGGAWTDFNLHDPGITILEVLCYALTDLVYRTSYSMPDLLANGGANPYASLHLAPEILSCHPVTITDLRRLVLDVEGVKNAWIEPVTTIRGFLLPPRQTRASADTRSSFDPTGHDERSVSGLDRDLRRRGN